MFENLIQDLNCDLNYLILFLKNTLFFIHPGWTGWFAPVHFLSLDYPQKREHYRENRAVMY